MSANRVFIGVDIGGTNTKIAQVDEMGQISLLRRVMMSDVGPSLEQYLRSVTSEIRAVMQQSSQKIEGIGISSPGLQMEGGTGTLYSVNMPRLMGVDLKKYFSETFGIAAVCSNDLVAHSLAEYRFGSGRGVRNFLSVSIGTGIGHTFIQDGNPVMIVNGVSGDSGRMILDVNSDICDSSGIYGSAEALCGVHAIELLAKEKFGVDCRFTAYDIIKAAREEDGPACDIMAVIARRVAWLLMNLSSIYFPDLISLTGGQTEAGPAFLQACRAEFCRISRGFFTNYFTITGQDGDIRIVTSEAGGLAGVAGCVVPLLQQSTMR